MASIKGMKAGLRRNIDKHDPEKEPEKEGEVKLSKTDRCGNQKEPSKPCQAEGDCNDTHNDILF